MSDTPLLPARRFPDYKGAEGRKPSKFGWGVVRAAQCFAREAGFALHATWLSDRYSIPAWYAIKP